MQPRYRFLQTVMREEETSANGFARRFYRYDLLAHCPAEERYYIIRAYKGPCDERVHNSRAPHKTPREDRDDRKVEVMVAEGIYGVEERIRDLFLDLAHARDPLDPIHLPDIILDSADGRTLDGSELRETQSIDAYWYYERAVNEETHAAE
ncbi:MAG: hypothetical protein R6U92_08000 [Bacillota bacterium]